MSYYYYTHEITDDEIKKLKEMKNHEEVRDFLYSLPTVQCFGEGITAKMLKNLDDLSNQNVLNKETVDYFDENHVMIFGEDGWESIVKGIKQESIDYFKLMLERTEDFEKNIRYFKRFFEGRVNELEFDGIEMSRTRDELNDSSYYEVFLWEVIRIYKTFDFENKRILFWGH